MIFLVFSSFFLLFFYVFSHIPPQWTLSNEFPHDSAKNREKLSFSRSDLALVRFFGVFGPYTGGWGTDSHVLYCPVWFPAWFQVGNCMKARYPPRKAKIEAQARLIQMFPTPRPPRSGPVGPLGIPPPQFRPPLVAVASTGVLPSERAQERVQGYGYGIYTP